MFPSSYFHEMNAQNIFTLKYLFHKFFAFTIFGTNKKQSLLRIKFYLRTKRFVAIQMFCEVDCGFEIVRQL